MEQFNFGADYNSKKDGLPYFHHQQVKITFKCAGIYASV